MKRLGYSVDRAPYAVRGCTGLAFCVAGCTAGAKVTVQETYLDPARHAGAQILTDTEAIDIAPLRDVESNDHTLRNIRSMPFRYVVRCRDVRTGEVRTIMAKILILGGGTVGTAKLLLNSHRWLPKLSLHVGKNIAVNGTVKTLGILPEGFIEGDMFTGRSHPGVISYEFLSSRGITLSTAKPLPVDAVSYANIVLAGDTRPHPWWGAPKVELMKLYRRRALVLYALGLTTPTAELHRARSGDVQPRFSLDPQFRDYYKSTCDLLHSIFVRNGAQVVMIKIIDGQGSEYPDLHITTAHMIGSCRMADNVKQGVVDVTGEVFNYPGMYITDGAAIPSSLAVNPYLTILANAERVAEFLANWYTRGAARIVREQMEPRLQVRGGVHGSR
jgi:cholesterol oxidase